jgi:capsular exopolysaccharide synthesis family protein
MYSADVTLYVSLQGRADSSDSAYQANQLAKDRVVSYASLMRDERITQAVVTQLKLPMTAEQLASKLIVTIQPDTVVMTASVTDTSPERAAAIANAVAQQFVALVQQLEQPIGPAPAPPPVGQPAPAPTQIGAQIIRQATPSPVPVSPNIPFGIALGGALGLLIGIGAAFMRHTRDTSIGDAERLQALTSVATLAEIPTDRNVRIAPIAIDQAPGSARAESYRRLRTNLQFHDGASEHHRGAKVIVVTSALVGEGTSATACNLARALAEGSHVLLIDANLRHPQVETYLDLEPGPGLTTVLTGRLMWPFARRWLREVPLEVLPAGPVAPRLGELLTWRGMDNLLEDVRKTYDFVIIDAPALLPVSDAAAVAARADGVVLVVRYRRTSEEHVAAAVAALEAVSARLIGTVLTMTPTRKARRRQLRAYPDRPPSLLPLLGPTRLPSPRNDRPTGGFVGAGPNGSGPTATPAPETPPTPTPRPRPVADEDGENDTGEAADMTATERHPTPNP